MVVTSYSTNYLKSEINKLDDSLVTKELLSEELSFIEDIGNIVKYYDKDTHEIKLDLSKLKFSIENSRPNVAGDGIILTIRK